MATLDGYNPYPFGMTAQQVIQALKKGYVLDDTLTNYSQIFKSATAPEYDSVSNTESFWYNTSTDKLYRSVRNTDEQILLWFEV